MGAGPASLCGSMPIQGMANHRSMRHERPYRRPCAEKIGRVHHPSDKGSLPYTWNSSLRPRARLRQSAISAAQPWLIKGSSFAQNQYIQQQSKVNLAPLPFKPEGEGSRRA